MISVIYAEIALNSGNIALKHGKCCSASLLNYNYDCFNIFDCCQRSSISQ